jgi:hypothetical protein
VNLFALSFNLVRQLKRSACKWLYALYFTFFTIHAGAVVVIQDASVSLGTDFDTNPIMSSEDSESIWRYTVLPRYNISATQDQNRWYSNAAVRFQRSSDKEISVDREDPTVNIGWDRDYDRGRFGLIANYNKNSTRIVEFDGTGLVVNDGSTTTRFIGANWQHLLTENLSLNLGSRLLKTKFSGGSGFTDFSTKSVNSTLSYSLTENLSPFIQFGHTSLDSRAPNADIIKSQNYMLGSNFTLSPNLNLTAAVGMTHVSDVGNREVANANFNYFGERYQLRGAVERTVTPSSLGVFQEADRYSLGYAYDLSEKSRLGSDFILRVNNTVNNIRTKQLVGYYTRSLNEYWQMRLFLQLRELDNTTANAHGETLGFTFTFNTPEF